MARGCAQCASGRVSAGVSGIIFFCMRVVATDESRHYAEPYWAFDCALIFWSVIKFGQESINSSELKSALFAANCE